MDSKLELEQYIRLAENNTYMKPQIRMILMIMLCSYSSILILIVLGGPLYLVKNVLLVDSSV